MRPPTIHILSRIVTPLGARKYLMLSQSQMGRALGAVHPNGRNGTPFSPKTISAIEHGRYHLNDYLRECYRRVIVAEALADSKGAVTAQVKFVSDKRLRVVPLIKCRRCEREFGPERANVVNCKKCRKG